MKDFEKLKNQIEITITAEGLRIKLPESETGTFFNSGSPNPTDRGNELLAMLAAELGKLPNKEQMRPARTERTHSAICS